MLGGKRGTIDMLILLLQIVALPCAFCQDYNVDIFLFRFVDKALDELVRPYYKHFKKSI